MSQLRESLTGVFTSFVMFLGYFCFFASSAKGQVDGRSDTTKQRILANETPAAGFLVTLPDRSEITHNGLDTPNKEVRLLVDFHVPKPSKIVLPAGTVIRQGSKPGWDELTIESSSGQNLKVSMDTFVGVMVRPLTIPDNPQIKVPPTPGHVLSVIKDVNERNPPVKELYSMLCDAKNLRGSECREVLRSYCLKAPHALTRKEILDLHEFQRASIASLRASWQITHTNGTRLVGGLGFCFVVLEGAEAGAGGFEWGVGFGFSFDGSGFIAAGAETDAGVGDQGQQPRLTLAMRSWLSVLILIVSFSLFSVRRLIEVGRWSLGVEPTAKRQRVAAELSQNTQRRGEADLGQWHVESFSSLGHVQAEAVVG